MNYLLYTSILPFFWLGGGLACDIGRETCCGVWCGGVCDGSDGSLGFSGFSGFLDDSSVTCFNAIPWNDCMVSILKPSVSGKENKVTPHDLEINA